MDMSQFEKFKARLMQKRMPKDITAVELQSFMTKYGFLLAHKSGSHFTYSHPKLERALPPIPMHSPIKPCYLEMIQQAINEIEGDKTK
jgi:predicted RNA binding protein YcfA (HicA-like mRNA interferase family)